MVSFVQFLRGAALLTAGSIAPCAAQSGREEAQRSVRSPAVSYTNVLVRQRADPQILKHTDGNYFFIATVPEYNRVVIRKSATIQGLGSAPERTLWARANSSAGVGYVWAPELHRIDGKWYIYLALGRTSAFDIRIFVLEGAGADPTTATWTEKGFITTDWDSFSLDATTFVVNGTRYLCWAQPDATWAESHNTALLIAPMVNPWTIRRPATVISRPDLAWERIGYKVNEGAYAIVRNGRVFITYSASATDHNYAMGMLTADVGAGLMSKSSWRKSATPVFATNDRTSQYGPGHAAFTVSEDGLSDVLVYHARGYRNITGDPLNNPDRHTRVQKVYWKPDGTPDLGVPVPDGETPVRFRSCADESLYVRHVGGAEGSQARLDGVVASLAETQFRLVRPGLNGGGGSGTVSLESTSHPGSFLRVSDGQLRFGRNDNSAAFRRDASFKQARGLAECAGFSFESVAAPGQYIRGGQAGGLLVSSVSGDAQQKEASFYTE